MRARYLWRGSVFPAAAEEALANRVRCCLEGTLHYQLAIECLQQYAMDPLISELLLVTACLMG